MIQFCHNFCGQCAACVAAKAAEDRMDAVFASLSDDDIDSIYRHDPDDPRTFALDHKGRP